MSIIQKTIEHLKKGDILLCPTDTIWGLSCDATNFDAAEKIYDIKGRSKEKSFIVLVSDVEMLRKYIDKLTFDVEKISAPYHKPVTIIYPKAKNLASNVIAANGSIAIRIVKKGFTHNLIKEYGKPLVSTSANFSNEGTAKTFDEINPDLKLKVDYIVESDFGKDEANASTILLVEDEEIKVLRA